ncbi:caspase family protein [Streptomyces niveus]|uniref:caspase family protein n=1 Tax=Streptomyces niveus TaxID=193462 RepID=UPI0036D29177
MYYACAMVPEPTRAEMLHAVESFLEDRQASETALLYFSGHGEFCEDDNQSSPERRCRWNSSPAVRPLVERRPDPHPVHRGSCGR